jgi:hypothetical protein
MPRRNRRTPEDRQHSALAELEEDLHRLWQKRLARQLDRQTNQPNQKNGTNA